MSILATVGGIQDQSVVWRDTKEDLAAIATQIWQDLTSSSDFTLAGSIGKLIIPIIIAGNAALAGAGKSVVTSATSYCTPTQYFDFCDERPAEDLCSDTEVRLTRAQLIACSPFLNTLLASSGEVEAAALLGGRYTAIDMQALIAAGGAQSQTLIRVVAKLTEARLIQRRPDVGSYQLTSAHHDIISEGGWLDKLASGERIFAFQETADSGRLHHETNSATTIRNRDLATQQAKRYFGRRADVSDPRHQ